MVKIGSSSMSESFEPPELYLYGPSYTLSKSTPDIIEEYFNDRWRSGHEIRKVIITQRFYQTSSNTVQA